MSVYNFRKLTICGEDIHGLHRSIEIEEVNESHAQVREVKAIWLLLWSHADILFLL